MSDRTTDYMIYYSYSCGILKVNSKQYNLKIRSQSDLSFIKQILKLITQDGLTKCKVSSSHCAAASFVNLKSGKKYPLCQYFQTTAIK